jgi:hypothetical protein
LRMRRMLNASFLARQRNHDRDSKRPIASSSSLDNQPE